eukprot:6235008-Pyramimonas_sp.AAC.1
MCRKPFDPPPPVDSSQGCLACSILPVLVLIFFPIEFPLGLRRVSPATRKDCPGSSRSGCRGFSCPGWLQDGPRWPPRCFQDGKDGLQDGSGGPKMPPRCFPDGLR